MARILIIGDPTSPLNQARGIVGQRAGHQIFWFSAQRADVPGVIYFSMPQLPYSNSVTRNLLRPFYLHRAIVKIQPDLVHVFYAQTGLMVFQLRKSHALVVTVMGGDIMPDQGYNGLSALFIRSLLDEADCITSKSAFMDEALSKIGNYRSKIKRITWGIDLSRFHRNRDVSRLRLRWSIPASDLVFFDPRLAKPFYNKHIIVEAFAGYLGNGGSSATLLISEAFSDPEYIIQLKRQTLALKISDKVRFVGAISYDEMPDYYALADVTISVPPSDGLPQTIYEAFASGSFLVLGDLPQYAGVVEDGVTARLIPVGDVGELMRALLWTSANAEILQRSQAIGRQYVLNHANLDVQAALVNDIYDQLLKVGRQER